MQLIQTPTHESNYGNGKGGNGQNLGRKVDPVNFEIDAFRQRLAGPPKETLPLYSETNELLGEVTIVDGRKAYLPDTVRSSL